MKNNAVQNFINKELNVKVLNIGRKPYFALADICKCLGFTNPSVKAGDLKNLIKQGIMPADCMTIAGATAVVEGDTMVYTSLRAQTFVSEAAMYMVVCSSEKRAAKRFLAWVCNTVLPAIRKTGGYIDGEENLSGEEREALNAEKARLVKRVSDLEYEKAQLEDENEELLDLIHTLKRADAGDDFEAVDGVYANDPDFQDFGFGYRH